MSTYRVFSATADEPTHVGAGLELIQLHQYHLQRVNPPLARIVLAVVPYIGGMRFNPEGNYYDQLHSVFYGRGVYRRNLFLGRAGNLLFFILASVALWVWVSHAADAATALAAVFLFTFQPVILGHAGLATNDMAATAGFAVSIVVCSAWLRKPTIVRALLLATACAFAIACKFSNIAFVPVACAALLAVHLVADRRRWQAIVLRAGALCLCVAVLTPILIWAAYGFTVRPLSEMNEVADILPVRAQQFVLEHQSAPLPAPSFFWGLAEISRIDRFGMEVYFNGVVRTNSGWPAYFLEALALKLTIASLILIAVAAPLALSRHRLSPQTLLAAAVMVAAILVLAARSNLDLGIRYILPLIVPLTAIAAISGVALARSSGGGAIIVTVLLAVHGITSIASHPDYFPYFNALAGRDPSRYLVDSNLDWGQDVLRLGRVLRDRHVERIGVAITGTPDFRALRFPPDYPLDPARPSSGWVAVSDHLFRIENARGGWKWLEGRPYTRVGKSIRLFQIP